MENTRRRRTRSYQRIYKACQRCRQRKVRCDLGSTDAPEPPCAKCRRERKQCVFDEQPRGIWRPYQARERHASAEDIPTTITAHPHQQANEEPLLNTVVRDDTDALQLLFDAATPQQRQRLVGTSSQPQQPDPDARLAAWSNFWPCSQQYLTQAECGELMDFFYASINSHTPIIADYVPVHRDEMIREDPLLCGTVLMIASRYKQLSGHNGYSRSFLIHDMLFKQVQEGIQHLLWGHDFNRQSGMTVIGAIETLLLIVHWQPRSLHLQIPLPSLCIGGCPRSVSRDYVNETARATATRADAMCWRLLSLAISLAIEHNLYLNVSDNEMSINRVTSARKSLYICVTSLSIRLKLLNPLRHVPVASVKSPNPVNGQTGLNIWVDLVELSSTTSDLLYSSPESTKSLIEDGRYGTIVARIQGFLDDVWSRCQSLNVASTFQIILEIEFHHTRIFAHSIVLQSLTERNSQGPVRSLSALHPSHSGSIEQISSDCGRIFGLVSSLDEKNSLRELSVPTILRIVTASMFVLKIVALRPESEGPLLTAMLKGMQLLRARAVDDIHLIGYYATMIESLSQKMTAPPISQPGAEEHGQTLQHNVNDAFLTPENWNDWLAFEFDPTFANLDSLGYDGRLSLAL